MYYFIIQAPLTFATQSSLSECSTELVIHYTGHTHISDNTNFTYIYLDLYSHCKIALRVAFKGSVLPEN